MELDPIKAFVTEKCDGWVICVDVCPFKAIKPEEKVEKDMKYKTISIDTALCKGCGLCVASCPKEGIEVQGFTMGQLKSQIHAALIAIDSSNEKNFA
jgi:heterodisulfide reductase subunit A